MIKLKLIHYIGMHWISPMRVKMWCLKAIMKDINSQINKLPDAQANKYKEIIGRFDA